jgi:6-phosphofructokinase 1
MIGPIPARPGCRRRRFISEESRAMLGPADLKITTLGERRFASPLVGRRDVAFVDRAGILLQTRRAQDEAAVSPLAFEEAGPHERIYFDPARTRAAIVTCGGLSPGLNNVIRSAYLQLHYGYGVPRVLGIRYGYAGLDPAAGPAPIELTTDYVDQIHNLGGTVLGSSRGPLPAEQAVEFLRREGIDILLCVGGDGTQRGAHEIAQELIRQGEPRVVVGIPKTIDNDIPFVTTSFGYLTALEVAAEVLRGAHVEARGAPNGIGVVKLMGRYAGYIAAGAAVASQDANFVLVPEVQFPLDGPDGFLAALEQRMRVRGHALVVVAEGAGEDLLAAENAGRDASGNRKLPDIGPFLCDRIKAHFKAQALPVNLKYIDPSYAIRSVPANAGDRILCDWMARYAVHAAMAGKTDLFIGHWAGEMVHVPIGTALAQPPKRIELTSDLWSAVRGCTGQPDW